MELMLVPEQAWVMVEAREAGRRKRRHFQERKMGDSAHCRLVSLTSTLENEIIGRNDF